MVTLYILVCVPIVSAFLAKILTCFKIARAGSKKTAFANFAEICRLLKRQPKHVLQFLMAELGTTGSIDGNNCLIVKGRFQQKHFESVLRKYIKVSVCLNFSLRFSDSTYSTALTLES